MNIEETIHQPNTSVTEAYYRYKCGHCDSQTVGFAVAYSPRQANNPSEWKTAWLRCNNPACNKGSVLVEGRIFPEPTLGFVVNGLPTEIELAYKEARKCFSVGAFTSCELMCRKILMYSACEKGAMEGEKFAFYIDFLKGKGFVTPTMEPWVEIIREHGNDSTHKLKPPDNERAESTLMFTGQLLKLIYEMQSLSDKYKKP
jgi:uncharacterized protein DUF4145